MYENKIYIKFLREHITLTTTRVFNIFSELKTYSDERKYDGGRGEVVYIFFISDCRTVRVC